MEEKIQATNQNDSINQTKRIRCIVKLGGAAITCKNELETIHEENLKGVSAHLRQSMISQQSSGKILGMDWSKRAGESGISCGIDDFRDQPTLGLSPFIVVHGAGSFGHFQASESGVHKGGLDLPLVKAGFVATRISVTKLNLEIVRALASGTDFANTILIAVASFIFISIFSRVFLLSVCLLFHADGQPAKEMSVTSSEIASADLSGVTKAVNSGFVPVMHGDAVLDDSLGCTILSGDVIIRHLAVHFKPEYVVFLTDVLGVYDRPPSESTAVLLREIAVREDGSWSVVKPSLENTQVEITVSAHDTTGGMETKISEAAMITKLGIDVYIVKAGTSHSLRALNGELRSNIPDDWLGTVIRSSK